MESLFFVIPAYLSCCDAHLAREVQAGEDKLYVWGMGHTVDHVSLGARFLEMREIFKSWFLPGLWRESDAVSWARLVGGGWTLEVVHMLSWGLDRSSPRSFGGGFALFQADDPTGRVWVQKTSHDGVLTWLVV